MFSSLLNFWPTSLKPDQLVFGPYSRESDADFGHMEHHVTITAQDGTELNGWFFNRGKNKPLVVWYSGKSAHIGHNIPQAVQDTDRSYLLMNYRGYGWNKGIPEEWNMIADARHCIAWCREQMGGYSKLIVNGYSLGTGVAVQVAAAEHADKLFLLAPYDCIYNAAVHLASMVTPFIPRPLIEGFCGMSVGNLLQSVRYAPLVTCPVVIYFAKHDTVIPHFSTWNLYHAFSETVPTTVWIDCPHESIGGQQSFWESYWYHMTHDEYPEKSQETPWMMVENGDNYYEGRNGCTQDYDKALECYRCAANSGYHWGYYNVGKCYLEGKGVSKDADEARTWFLKAAEQENFWAKLRLAEMGDAVYMSEVGDCYYDGRAEYQEVGCKPESAFEWYSKSAEGGYHWGCYNVGKCYLEGKGVPKDDNKARQYFRKAAALEDNPWALRRLAELGDVSAALQVREFYETGSRDDWGMRRNEEDAKHFRQLVEAKAMEYVKKGDAFYEAKDGCPYDVDLALVCYRKAAECGHHWGYFNMGKCYSDGIGVQKDDNEAREWFRKAVEASSRNNFWALLRLAELGDAECMCEVGDHYSDGRSWLQGCNQSDEKAFEWYRKSAEGGYHWGCHNVGEYYLKGKSVPKNDEEARKWFRKAVDISDNPWSWYWLAEMGDAEAALRVSDFYASGCHADIGMPQDDGKAQHFREIANR